MRVRICTLSLDVLLWTPLFMELDWKDPGYHAMDVVDADGWVWRVGLRKRVVRAFTKSLSCAHCGKQGTYFAVERFEDAPEGRARLQLYSDDGMRLTLDHILPKAMGGRTMSSNLQTMCERCNVRKGHKISPATREKIREIPDLNRTLVEREYLELVSRLRQRAKKIFRDEQKRRESSVHPPQQPVLSNDHP